VKDVHKAGRGRREKSSVRVSRKSQFLSTLKPNAYDLPVAVCRIVRLELPMIEMLVKASMKEVREEKSRE